MSKELSMTKTTTLLLLSVVGVMALTPIVRAEDTSKPASPSDHGTMGGDMQGMMNMMGQMTKMMENCNRMMEIRQNDKGSTKKDGRG
jgi:hypothetical protein